MSRNGLVRSTRAEAALKTQNDVSDETIPSKMTFSIIYKHPLRDLAVIN